MGLRPPRRTSSPAPPTPWGESAEPAAGTPAPAARYGALGRGHTERSPSVGDAPAPAPASRLARHALLASTLLVALVAALQLGGSVSAGPRSLTHGITPVRGSAVNFHRGRLSGYAAAPAPTFRASRALARREGLEAPAAPAAVTRKGKIDVYRLKGRSNEIAALTPRGSQNRLPAALPAAVVVATASLTTLLAQAAEDAAAIEAVKEEKTGWFGSIVKVLENVIVTTADFLHSRGVEGSTGIAVVLVTVLVRTIVLPLNFASLKSTSLMQAIQPRMKEIQEKYKDDQETQGALILQVYQKAGVNPLAGLIPAFAQIPVFLAFYRAISNLAKDNKLSDGFLWIPSLEGPTFQQLNLEWLTKGWDGFNPSLGWHDTLAYLALPAIYVVGQSLSQKILAPPQPPSADGAPNPASGFTKFLPILIGYFSLNVPSALVLYWVVSNAYSVSSSLISRAVLANDPKVAELKELMSAPMIVEDVDDDTDNPATPNFMDASAGFPPSSSSGEAQQRTDRGARFRALKAAENGEPTEEPTVFSSPNSDRGARFRALKAQEQASKSESETEAEKVSEHN